MKLTRLRCPNCGADFENVDLEQGQRVFKCTRLGCGATFIVDQGEKFADIDKREAEKIEQYRTEMNNALSPFDQYLAMRYAENIIAILPNDFRAKAVLSIAQSTDNNKRPLYNFLSSKSDCTTEEFEEIFPVILRYCDYRGLKLLEESIQNIPDNQIKSKMQFQINRQKAYLKQKNDDYADVPRDVFICHSSDDIDVAMKVVKELEDDGNTCWISERNMPPDSRYYWEKIEKSIQQCTIFLVLCSNSAMQSDAVQREISIADSSQVKRLELKLDDTPHTILFKHFFDGINWIDGSNTSSHGIDKIKLWVYRLKHEKNLIQNAELEKNKHQEDIIKLELEQEKLDRENKVRKQRIEAEQLRQKEKELEKERNKISKKAKVFLFLFVLFPGLFLLYSSITAISNNEIIGGILLILPSFCLILAWMFGRRVIKNKGYLMWPLIFIGFGVFYVINSNNLIPQNIFLNKYRSPTIKLNEKTNEKEGIYTYNIRNYVGRNAASIGEKHGNIITDDYGEGRINIIFVTQNGYYVDINERENYTIVAQNLPANTPITIVHERNSQGKPYSNLVDYQSFDEIVLYVSSLDDQNYRPEMIDQLPTLDRHCYHIRDYTGRNAASFGSYSYKNRIDEYGAGRIKLIFISDDGSNIDPKDFYNLKQYIITNQGVDPNTELLLTYETNSFGREYNNLISNQNIEEIVLYVSKIEEQLIARYPTSTPTPIPTQTPSPVPTADSSNFLYKIEKNGEVTITKYIGNSSYVRIPIEIDGHKITKIGVSAFENNQTLENVTIMANIQSFESYAFKGCSKLNHISIPNETTFIGDSVFENCISLESITIWGNVKEFGDSVFRGCTNLKSIRIPNETTSFGNSIFENCSSLESISIWGDPITIPQNAFKNCTSLISIRIPNGTTKIESSAFENCSSLQSVSIWGKIEIFGEKSFMGCINLKSITIPRETVSIESRAFSDCISLESVNIYSRNISIAADAFDNCPKLSEIPTGN